MDIGISYWFGYASLPKERVNLIKNAGFTNVALHWTNEYKDVTGDKKVVAKTLESQNIKISSLHLSYDDAHLIWDDSEDGKRYRKAVLNSIMDAKVLGTDVVVLHTNGVIGTEKALKINRLFEIIEFAEKNCISLCIENLQNEDNLYWLKKLDNLRKMMFCYDCGHNNIRNCSFEKKDIERIQYVHISDNDGINDLHYIPYEGNIDWNNELNILAMINKPMILEVHRDIGSSKMAEEYLDLAYGAAKKISDEIKRRHI